MTKRLMRRTLLVAMLAIGMTILNSHTAKADLVIDTFGSTQSGNPEKVSDPTIGPFVPSISETNLTGVVGGASTVRTTTAARTGGINPVTGILNPAANSITFGTGISTGKFTIDYSQAGGLNADFGTFLGISIPLEGVELTGAMTAIPVTVTIGTDGMGTAVGTGLITTEGDSTLVIDAAAFIAMMGGVDLSDIDQITFLFETLSPGQEFTITGNLLEIMPEPATVFAWMTAGLCLMVGWRRYGDRLKVKA